MLLNVSTNYKEILKGQPNAHSKNYMYNDILLK